MRNRKGTYKALEYHAETTSYVSNPEIGMNIEVHVRGSHFAPLVTR